MKENLIIVGAGNVGGFLVLNQELFNNQYNIIGFLDDAVEKINKTFWGIPVLGAVDDLYKYPDVALVIGIADPIVKKKVLQKVGDNHKFPNFISENTWISNDVNFGKGIIIYPGVSINYETEIGDFVIINMNCAVGHNTRIEKCCSLAPGVNLAGFTHAEPFAEIGIGATTIQQVKIGEGSIIGGQSMVIKNTEAYHTYVGVPAKKKGF
ncbi:acetyltransferase [Allomuricauda sp. d1]|uniref:acetyltransferase n=1 Tax=Allomuricauda sp. d1 TaxID=3136725 RepID=UPI0031D5C0AE